MKKFNNLLTFTGLDWQRAKWGIFASRYILGGEKSAVKYADEIIVLSRNVQEYFLNQYGRKTVFIPNGVNKPEIVPAELIKQKWGLSKDNYILYVGRLVPEKGIKYLLEAWKCINTDKKLVLAGSPSDTEDFNLDIRKLADCRVIFTGFTQGKELEELYSNSFLYILPSDLEGMPLPVIPFPTNTVTKSDSGFQKALCTDEYLALSTVSKDSPAKNGPYPNQIFATFPLNKILNASG